MLEKKNGSHGHYSHIAVSNTQLKHTFGIYIQLVCFSNISSLFIYINIYPQEKEIINVIYIRYQAHNYTEHRLHVHYTYRDVESIRNCFCCFWGSRTQWCLFFRATHQAEVIFGATLAAVVVFFSHTLSGSCFWSHTLSGGCILEPHTK